MIHDEKRITMPGSPFGIVRGYLYGDAGTRADVFMPHVRELGAGLIRLFLWWGQIEPEPQRFVWDAVDTFLNQLEPSDEAWVVLGSRSLWATRRSTAMLPASPARNLDDYYRFVHTMVTHCKGRVRYWQMDNEPHNTTLFWDGTAQEYVDQLKVFYRAVKDADPAAVIILAGAAGLFNPAQMDPADQGERDFFDHIMREGAAFYDIFDLHLYGDPYAIPVEIDFLRQKMAGMGYQKPIFGGEYNGPSFFNFVENLPIMQGIFMRMMGNPQGGMQAQVTQKEAIDELYERMATLPPQTQMFMEGCPPELEQKRHRVNCRELVTRCLLAFSAGVQKMFCWNLANEKVDRANMMHLFFDKHKLFDYEKGVFKQPYPSAETFSRMTRIMAGVEFVRRIELPERPDTYLFEVQRREREPLFVVWERRDTFSGEDEPPVQFELSWRAPQAKATDVFGQSVPVAVHDNRLSMDISITPVFIEAR